MARLTQLSCAPTAVDADGICASQTPAGAGALLINGALATDGAVTLGAAQLLTITSASNLSARTFTVTGTAPGGSVQTEAITGPNATTVTGAKYFATVTGITVDAATGAALTVGNAITSVSKSIALPDLKLNPCNIGIGCVITGTITYTVQHCFDDPGTTYSSLNWFDHDTISGETANDDGNYAFPVTAIRVKVTASTSGTVTVNAIQAGV